MDITSYFYFSEFAKDLHITHTAERLFISQQTLSNHLHRLESYYGTPLFVQKPQSLTYAGQCVLEFANRLMLEHENLLNTIADIKKQEKGQIRFGSSMVRANSIIPNILPLFSSRYPKIELSMAYNVSSELEKSVTAGELDLALVILNDSVSSSMELDYKFIMRDYVLLCVSDYLMKKYYQEDAMRIIEKSKAGADLKDFKELPFCLSTSRMGQTIRNIFEEAEIKPNPYIIESTAWLGISPEFTRYNAACFTSQPGLLSNDKTTDIHYFPVFFHNKPVYSDLCLIWNKKKYLPKYLLSFIDLIVERAKKIEDDYCKNIANTDRG